MNTVRNNGLGRLGEMILYAFGAWISLTAVILALPWAPHESFMQAARLVLLAIAAIALLISVVGAATGLLSAFGRMSVKDPAPKP
ncbi:MAG: hypothetical protein ABL956_18125 [Hyphomonadaceae bacterium]